LKKIKLLISGFRLLIPGTGSPGGNFFHVAHLFQALSKLEELDVFIATDPATHAFLKNYVHISKLLVFGGTNITTREAQKCLIQSINYHNPDIVHKPVGQLPFKKIKIPTVVSIADLNFTVLKTSFIKKLYKEISYRHTLKNADAITCVSHYTASCVKKKFPSYKDKVVVVPHGTTLMEEPDQQFTANIQKPFWLTFGHRAHKNVELILKALNVLNKSKPNQCHNLIVVGGGIYIDKVLVPMAKNLDVSNQIHFVSNINQGQLSALYKECVGLIFVSKYEGFGLPILEAMGSGAPVIGSNVCSIPEIIKEAGEIVDVNDYNSLAEKMDIILTSSDRRNELIKSGYQRASDYSWENSAKMSYSVYKKLLNRACPKKSPFSKQLFEA
jgi:glycosyltransferase involved in cell wall biosynthesis